MQKDFCLECSPTHQLSHGSEWWASVMSETGGRLIESLVPRTVSRVADWAIAYGFLYGLRGAGLLKEAPIEKETHIHQRTRVVAEEAAARGMEVKVYTFFGSPTNFFVLKGTGFAPELFEGLPGIDPRHTHQNIDDKEWVRSMMKELGAPTPEGKSFFRLSAGLAYGAAIGFPLVVKPRHGSLSAHTTVNIRDKAALSRAIRVAQQISLSFIVERYIEGSLYRVTTVGGKVVAVGRRDPPFIVGDGISTVEELILKREKEQVGLMVALGYKPEEIPSLPRHHTAVDPSTILPPGEKMVVTWKINLSYGATVEDVTDLIHPETVALCEKIAGRLDHATIGIDFIAPSIETSWKEQPCAIIELNSLPSIDLHHPPIVIGTPRNVAGALLDYLARGKMSVSNRS